MSGPSIVQCEQAIDGPDFIPALYPEIRYLTKKYLIKSLNNWRPSNNYLPSQQELQNHKIGCFRIARPSSRVVMWFLQPSPISHHYIVEFVVTR